MSTTRVTYTSTEVVAIVPPSQMHPWLASYLSQLATHPLRTKQVTLGTLQFVQEVLASHLAGVPRRPLPANAPFYAHLLARAKIDSRALKMAFYGFFISAPLGHTLVGFLQKLFAGRTSTQAKIAQIIVNNLVVAPIQISVYLASMAVINGARSVDEVVKTVRAGFMNVMRLTWITSPLSLIIAQKYLAPELWVPFFNFVQFVMGTYFNTKMKKLRLAAQAREKKDQEDKQE
ncbi:hypothetical protein C8Q75DRAFT_719681 [Abortiporus biennis]|nr:hypothetical protein C8Q75DRAFT_719681 [Abortiporus biennis]